MDRHRLVVEQMFSGIGVAINGPHPWDIQVKDERVFGRILREKNLGLGESYMDGWWDVKDLEEFLFRLMKAELQKKIISPKVFYYLIKTKVINIQSMSGSKKVAEQHYDLGNEFYSSILDNKMQYTCAYWCDAKTLDEAQEKKLDLICKKLELKPGEKVLELGCGWGGFAKYAAEKYGVEVTAYNISKEQVKYARNITKGLKVKIIESDYRYAKGIYDKVVSIGMCEHVGHKNHKIFIDVANRCLKDGGLFLIHTIGANKTRLQTDPWIDKYIFPNSLIPSVRQLAEAFEGKFVLEDWHNFGPDYYTTLIEWDRNFEKSWKKHKHKFDEKFYRMWKFYLMASAASFRVRNNQLWQIVLSKGRRPQAYRSVR